MAVSRASLVDRSAMFHADGVVIPLRPPHAKAVAPPASPAPSELMDASLARLRVAAGGLLFAAVLSGAAFVAGMV